MNSSSSISPSLASMYSSQHPSKIKRQLDLSSRSSALTRLSVKNDGTLGQISIIYVLLKKIERVLARVFHFNSYDRTNSRFVELKAIQLLSEGKTLFKTAEEIKKVKKLAEKLGLTPANKSDHSELQELVDKICNPTLQSEQEETSANLVEKFFKKHEQALTPFSEEIKTFASHHFFSPSATRSDKEHAGTADEEKHNETATQQDTQDNKDQTHSDPSLATTYTLSSEKAVPTVNNSHLLHIPDTPHQTTPSNTQELPTAKTLTAKILTLNILKQHGWETTKKVLKYAIPTIAVLGTACYLYQLNTSNIADIVKQEVAKNTEETLKNLTENLTEQVTKQTEKFILDYTQNLPSVDNLTLENPFKNSVIDNFGMGPLPSYSGFTASNAGFYASKAYSWISSNFNGITPPVSTTTALIGTAAVASAIGLYICLKRTCSSNKEDAFIKDLPDDDFNKEKIEFVNNENDLLTKEKKSETDFIDEETSNVKKLVDNEDAHQIKFANDLASELSKTRVLKDLLLTKDSKEEIELLDEIEFVDDEGDLLTKEKKSETDVIDEETSNVKKLVDNEDAHQINFDEELASELIKKRVLKDLLPTKDSKDDSKRQNTKKKGRIKLVDNKDDLLTKGKKPDKTSKYNNGSDIGFQKLTVDQIADNDAAITHVINNLDKYQKNTIDDLFRRFLLTNREQAASLAAACALHDFEKHKNIVATCYESLLEFDDKDSIVHARDFLIECLKIDPLKLLSLLGVILQVGNTNSEVDQNARKEKLLAIFEKLANKEFNYATEFAFACRSAYKRLRENHIIEPALLAVWETPLPKNTFNTIEAIKTKRRKSYPPGTLRRNKNLSQEKLTLEKMRIADIVNDQALVDAVIKNIPAYPIEFINGLLIELRKGNVHKAKELVIACMNSDSEKYEDAILFLHNFNSDLSSDPEKHAQIIIKGEIYLACKEIHTDSPKSLLNKLAERPSDEEKENQTLAFLGKFENPDAVLKDFTELDNELEMSIDEILDNDAHIETIISNVTAYPNHLEFLFLELAEKNPEQAINLAMACVKSESKKCQNILANAYNNLLDQDIEDRSVHATDFLIECLKADPSKMPALLGVILKAGQGDEDLDLVWREENLLTLFKKLKNKNREDAYRVAEVCYAVNKTRKIEEPALQKVCTALPLINKVYYSKNTKKYVYINYGTLYFVEDIINEVDKHSHLVSDLFPILFEEETSSEKKSLEEKSSEEIFSGAANLAIACSKSTAMECESLIDSIFENKEKYQDFIDKAGLTAPESDSTDSDQETTGTSDIANVNGSDVDKAGEQNSDSEDNTQNSIEGTVVASSNVITETNIGVRRSKFNQKKLVTIGSDGEVYAEAMPIAEPLTTERTYNIIVRKMLSNDVHQYFRDKLTKDLNEATEVAIACIQAIAEKKSRSAKSCLKVARKAFSKLLRSNPEKALEFIIACVKIKPPKAMEFILDTALVNKTFNIGSAQFHRKEALKNVYNQLKDASKDYAQQFAEACSLAYENTGKKEPGLYAVCKEAGLIPTDGSVENNQFTHLPKSKRKSSKLYPENQKLSSKKKNLAVPQAIESNSSSNKLVNIDATNPQYIEQVITNVNEFAHDVIEKLFDDLLTNDLDQATRLAIACLQSTEEKCLNVIKKAYSALLLLSPENALKFMTACVEAGSLEEMQFAIGTALGKNTSHGTSARSLRSVGLLGVFGELYGANPEYGEQFAESCFAAYKNTGKNEAGLLNVYNEMIRLLLKDNDSVNKIIQEKDIADLFDKLLETSIELAKEVAIVCTTVPVETQNEATLAVIRQAYKKLVADNPGHAAEFMGACFATGCNTILGTALEVGTIDKQADNRTILNELSNKFKKLCNKDLEAALKLAEICETNKMESKNSQALEKVIEIASERKELNLDEVINSQTLTEFIKGGNDAYLHSVDPIFEKLLSPDPEMASRLAIACVKRSMSTSDMRSFKSLIKKAYKSLLNTQNEHAATYATNFIIACLHTDSIPTLRSTIGIALSVSLVPEKEVERKDALLRVYEQLREKDPELAKQFAWACELTHQNCRETNRDKNPDLSSLMAVYERAIHDGLIIPDVDVTPDDTENSETGNLVVNFNRLLNEDPSEALQLAIDCVQKPQLTEEHLNVIRIAYEALFALNIYFAADFMAACLQANSSSILSAAFNIPASDIERPINALSTRFKELLDEELLDKEPKAASLSKENSNIAARFKIICQQIIDRNERKMELATQSLNEELATQSLNEELDRPKTNETKKQTPIENRVIKQILKIACEREHLDLDQVIDSDSLKNFIEDVEDMTYLHSANAIFNKLLIENVEKASLFAIACIKKCQSNNIGQTHNFRPVLEAGFRSLLAARDRDEHAATYATDFIIACIETTNMIDLRLLIERAFNVSRLENLDAEMARKAKLLEVYEELKSIDPLLAIKFAEQCESTHRNCSRKEGHTWNYNESGLLAVYDQAKIDQAKIDQAKNDQAEND